MSTIFYKWGERDLEKISARSVKKGDEIALYGENRKYGFITIDDVSISADTALLQYTLPIGAFLSSDEDTEISIFWVGNKPLIQILQSFSLNDCMIIRKK